MPDPEPQPADSVSPISPWPPRIAMLLITVYCLAFLIRIPDDWPGLFVHFHRYCVNHVLAGIKSCTSSVANHPGYSEIYTGLYFFLILLLIPLIPILMLRRARLDSLGIRRPNKIGIRVLFIGYLLALPATYWVACSPKFVSMYASRADRAGYLVLSFWFLTNVIGEHFLFHGVVLALGRRGLRWPARTSVQSTGTSTTIRTLQWLGLAQPTGTATGVRRITLWIGLPTGCGLAIWTSAILFAAVHLGKSPRELLVSVPNGLLLAYAAYRTDTWLVPLALHVAAAITSFFIAMYS